MLILALAEWLFLLINKGEICQSCQYFKWRNWGQKFQITVFLLSLSSRRGMGDSCLLALGYLFVVDGKRRRRQQLLTMGSPSKPSRKKMKSSWNAHCSNINTTHLSLAATKIYEARIFWYHSSHDSSQIFYSLLLHYSHLKLQNTSKCK